MPEGPGGMEERPAGNPFPVARVCCDDTEMDDLEVRVTDDPDRVLREAGPYLRQDPVSHNSVLSVLCEARGEVGSGRWWTVLAAGKVVGVAGQCPPTMPLLLTPMLRPAVAAIATTVAADPEVHVPGVMGEAATAATFAGCWSEQVESRVRVHAGQRLYRLGALADIDAVPGGLRPARDDDRAGLLPWFRAFVDETAASMPDDLDERLTRMLSSGELHVWEDGEVVAMARATPAAAGASRIGYVFTPAELRGRGYASACVAALSAHVRDVLHVPCLLYTELANPSSNRIYRRLGYRAESEVLIYDFTAE